MFFFEEYEELVGIGKEANYSYPYPFTKSLIVMFSKYSKNDVQEISFVFYLCLATQFDPSFAKFDPQMC